MNKYFKKNLLLMLISSIISSYSYAETLVGFNGSFLIKTPNGKLTPDLIKAQVYNLYTDTSFNQVELTTNSIVEESEFNYYSLDNMNNRVKENSVLNITGLPTNIRDSIFGGYSQIANGNVNNTNVIIGNSVTVPKFVFGAYSLFSATGNVYLKDNAKVSGDVYGAYSDSSDYSSADTSSTGNVYLMDNSTVSNSIYGAYSSSDYDSSAIGNIYLIDKSTVNADVYGAYSKSTDYNNSSATGNIYLMNNATVGSRVFGAYSIYSKTGYNSYAYANVYLMDNAKVSNEIYGAYALADDSSSFAIGNIYINDHSSIGSNVYGAYADATTPSANGNIYLKDNAQISGEVIGAYVTSPYYSSAISFSAEGNVYIYENVKLQEEDNGTIFYNSSLWGGYLGNTNTTYYNVFHNNLLSIGNAPLTVQTIGNFANYNFYLNEYNKNAIINNQALLTVLSSIENNDTYEEGDTVITKNRSTIHVAGISGKSIVDKDTEITLIDASNSGVFFIQGNTSNDTVSNISDLFKTKTGDTDIGVKVGLIGEADITYTIDSVNNKILVKIDKYKISEDKVNLNVKPLAEGRLAGLQNVVRGTDMLLDVIGENKIVGTYTPIAVINGGVNKYQSGSHIDSRDYRLMVGSRYQILDNLFAGLTFEYGRSNYDTHNDNNIDGSGHTYNYGASLFAKSINQLDSGNDIYIDGALRFGRTSTEFKSNDIITGSGNTAEYNSKVNYFGAHFGAGFIYALNDTNSFDTSAHYLWTRLGSDSVVLDGDEISFDKATSSRLQLKEQYNHKTSDNLTFTLAGIYEYEFNGKANANTSGISIDAPTVKGSTGIFELGIKGTPITDNKDFSFNLSFKGYGGKRNGASASAFINYDF